MAASLDPRVTRGGARIPYRWNSFAELHGIRGTDEFDMSGIVAVLLFALLFVGFGFLRRGSNRSAGCDSCELKDDPGSCGACPVSPERTMRSEYRAAGGGTSRIASRGPLFLVKTHTPTGESDDGDR